MTNATTLRTLVIDNRFNDKKLTEAQVGKESLKVLTTLYRGALDAITEWASKDYAHISTNEDHDAAFDAVKKILSCYTTEDDKINIELHIIVEYGVNIKVISDSIIGSVRYSVESMTGFKVGKVTVNVEGIRVEH